MLARALRLRERKLGWEEGGGAAGLPGAGRGEEGALGCRGFAIEGKTAGTREEGAAGCWGICI